MQYCTNVPQLQLFETSECFSDHRMTSSNVSDNVAESRFQWQSRERNAPMKSVIP